MSRSRRWFPHCCVYHASLCAIAPRILEATEKTCPKKNSLRAQQTQLREISDPKCPGKIVWRGPL